jgi:hypothetical protein
VRKSLSDVLSFPLWGPAWNLEKEREPTSANGFFSPGQWSTWGSAVLVDRCHMASARILEAHTDSTIATIFLVHAVADKLSVNIW